MPRKRPQRPTWFKIQITDRPIVDMLSNEAVGEAVRAAVCYFDTGEDGDTSQLAKPLYVLLKAHVDDAWSDYKRAVEDGKKANQGKDAEGVGRVTHGYPRIPTDTHGTRIEEEENTSSSMKDSTTASPGFNSGALPVKMDYKPPFGEDWEEGSTVDQ